MPSTGEGQRTIAICLERLEPIEGEIAHQSIATPKRLAYFRAEPKPIVHQPILGKAARIEIPAHPALALQVQIVEIEAVIPQADHGADFEASEIEKLVIEIVVRGTVFLRLTQTVNIEGRQGTEGIMLRSLIARAIFHGCAKRHDPGIG